MWMTCLARAGKCARFGACDECAATVVEASAPESPNSPTSPSIPKPVPVRAKSSRRDRNPAESKLVERLADDIQLDLVLDASIHEQELVRRQQHLRVLSPRIELRF